MFLPPSNALQIVPSDTVDLPFVTRVIYVGVGGNVRPRKQNGQDVIYKDLAGGSLKKCLGLVWGSPFIYYLLFWHKVPEEAVERIRLLSSLM